MVDIDINEINKPDLNVHQGFAVDSKTFISESNKKSKFESFSTNQISSWLAYCKKVNLFFSSST